MAGTETWHRRDAHLSARHRTWGHDLPAVDIDFLLVEYFNREPYAIIDYRHENGRINLKSANSIVLQRLGDRAILPAWIVVYSYPMDETALWAEPIEGPWKFRPVPLNDLARKYPSGQMIEADYVRWLETVRTGHARR